MKIRTHKVCRDYYTYTNTPLKSVIQDAMQVAFIDLPMMDICVVSPSTVNPTYYGSSRLDECIEELKKNRDHHMLIAAWAPDRNDLITIKWKKPKTYEVIREIRWTVIEL